MTDEKNKPEEKKVEKKLEKPAEAPKPVEKKEETKTETKSPAKKNEAPTTQKDSSNNDKESAEKTKDKKTDDKKDKKEKKPKKEEKPKVKKYEATANGRSLHISTKQAKYICAFIKNKEIDKAIADLQQVILMKKAIPFKGEIPHRKGKRMMSGRYPVKASKLFINMLKALKGNVLVNGLELEKTRIKVASASQAARPARREGREAKRTHVTLKAREINQKIKERKK